MKFRSKSRIQLTIPTSSIADIAFLLLIFFMVATVFKVYQGLPLTLPSAEKTERIETRRHVAHIWVTADGRISVDDMLVEMPDIKGIMSRKRVENPRIIVSLKTDRKAPYGLVSDIVEELRKAEALRVNFATTRARR